MRRMLPGIVLLAAVVPELAAAQPLVRRVEQFAFTLEDRIDEAFGRSLPLPSASAGVSYSFDPATGNFRRDPSTFGQLYLDRAAPLGAGRFNVSLSYQYVELDEIDGKPADGLHDRTPIPFPGRLAAVEFTDLGVEAAVHQALLAFAYGVTDDLEAGVAVPLVYSESVVEAAIRGRGLTEGNELITVRAAARDVQHVTGVGDVFVRAKYRLLDRRQGQLAAGLLLRLPAGHAHDLQGAGVWELAPGVLASTRIWEPARWARVQAHLNAAAGLDLENVDASEIRWGLGVDWGVTEGITLAAAVLARHQLERVAPPGFFDFPRCRGNLTRCATDLSARGAPRAPLFGLSGERVDYYDLSIGGRGALWRDTIFAFVNVIVPLNDGFVRAAPIPLVGLEATF